MRGFSLPSAIFLLVVLWLLGAAIVTITGTQQSSIALDAQGSRAYQAARAGIEWAAYQVLDPDNTLTTYVVPTDLLKTCPAASVTLPALAGSLSDFTVTVACTATDATEGNHVLRVFQITSTASIGTAGTANYVERRLQAVLTKCKDPTAPSPRHACG